MIILFVNKLFFIIKRFIFSVLIIYAFNMIVFPMGIIIPMNIFTIITTMIFGLPAIIGFSLFRIFVL